MTSPHLGLGLAPPPAPDGPSAVPPTRRAPRLAKRRHAATSSRSRVQPKPAAPWNPFGGGGTDGLRDDGNGRLGSGDAGASSGLGNDQTGGVVFGAAPALRQQSPRPATASSSETPFLFGSVRDSLPRFDEGWSATSNLHDDMGRLHLQNPGKCGLAVSKEVDQKDGSSIFGVDIPSLVSKSEANVLPEKLTQLNIGSGVPLQNESANSVPKEFVFGSNEAGSFADSRSSASSVADSYASSSVHVTEANGIWRQMVTEANGMPEKLTQFSLGSHVASGVNTDASGAVNGTDDASMLPEKITRLNIGSGTHFQHLKTGGGGIYQTEVFGFGGGGTAGTVFGNAPSNTLDKGNDFFSTANRNASSSADCAENLPPERTSHLNVGVGVTESMKNDSANCPPESFVFGRNVTSTSVSGQSARVVMDDGRNFCWGSSANACASTHGTVESTLPEKMTKLNIQHGTPSHSIKDEAATRQPDAFIFGTNTTASTPFTSFQSNVFSETKDNGRNLANEDIRSSTYSKSKNDKGSGPGNIVFSSSTATALSEGAAEHALQDEIKKLNIIREGPSVGCIKVNGASTPEFLFQSKVEVTAGYGTVPQSKVQESFQFAPSNHSASFSTFENAIPSFSSTTIDAARENAPGESCAVKQDPSTCSRESLFSIDFIKSAYRDKKEAHKSTRRKKQPTRLKQHARRYQVSQETCSNGLSSDIAGDYSPMDCSPYQVAVEQVSREASVSSDQSIHIRDSNVSNQNTSCAEDDLISATKHLVIDADLPTYKEEGRVPNSDTSENNFASSFNSFDEELTFCSASQPSVTNVNVGSGEPKIHTVEAWVNDSGCNVNVGSGEPKIHTVETWADDSGCNVNVGSGEPKIHTVEAWVDDSGCNVNVGSGEPKIHTLEAWVDDSGCNVENTSRILHESSEPVTFQPSSANISGLNFTFGASSPERPLSTQGRNTKRKLRTKGGQVPKPSATQASVQPKASQDEKNMQFSPETSKTEDSIKEQLTRAASISAALETCETWRTSGNQAYGNGRFATAEGCYTRGINSISHNGMSGRCSRALMLCYSNRAATRMSLGRMREALQDCLIATSIDPTFLKAKVRAANCQLALGDLENASRNYTACLESNNAAGSDIKMFTEASDGLERVKRVASWISQSKELLEKRTLPEATMALELISNALNISSHSDNLMEMKAGTLLTLRRYEEVIELCQETVDLSEKNSVPVNANEESNNSIVSEKTERSGILWRSYLICKSYFLLGKLDEALELLKKHEQLTPVKESDVSTSQQCFSSLSASIRQLLSCKAAGNESFQARRYSEAVEQYSAALACSSDSRPFSAVCFCNRAAAYQALGQLTDAIADCSLAMVLDANYPKAISRRATLYEMIRDYGQSANDLRKLISLIEKQANKPGASPKIINKHSDLNQARARLHSVENEAKDDTPLNLYLILGVEPSCSPADIKKAYRKAALRHHPDKAAQLLVRNENADDAFWRDVAKEVYADADHLFKAIGEAYNILSDPEKRQEYDIEENLRNAARRASKGMSRQRSPEQHYRKQYGRGFSPRQWQSTGQSNKGARSRWPGYGYSDDYW